VEWPKEISKFFSRQRLASISQVGFRVINISSLGVFYKNGGFYLEGDWLWRVSVGYSQERMVVLGTQIFRQYS